jgi:hypothetical protein
MTDSRVVSSAALTPAPCLEIATLPVLADASETPAAK